MLVSFRGVGVWECGYRGGWIEHCTDVVVLGDQRVDGARVLDVLRFDVFFVVLAGRLALVGLALEDGYEAVGDVVG